MARQPIASPVVTFTPEALQQVIAQAIAEHEAQKAQQAKSDTSADMEKLTIRAFARAGFKDVKPRVDTLTYNRWLEQGYRVKEGEHAVKVKNLRLFHVSQVQQMSPAEKKTALADLEAKKAKAAPVQAQPAPAPAKPVPAAPKVQRKSTKILIAGGGNA